MLTITLTKQEVENPEVYAALETLLSKVAITQVIKARTQKTKRKAYTPQRVKTARKTYSHIEVSADIMSDFGKTLRSKKALILLQIVKRHQTISKTKLLSELQAHLDSDFKLRNMNGVLMYLLNLARKQSFTLPYNTYINDVGEIRFAWL